MGKEMFNNIPSKLGDLLNDVKNGKIGLPDLQRPFVWKDNKVRELLDSMIKGYEDGQKSQEKRDIRAAVRAFFDIKVKDQDVYRLLSEYFNVDSIKEATEYLMDAKKTSQIIALREYCKSQGMNYREFREYADSHNLDEALLLNKRLLDVPPEKLKLILDKNEGRR